MTDRHTIVVLGDVNADMIVPMPRSGEKVRTPELAGGGTAANAAVGLARLGCDVRFIGKVGDDGIGDFLERDLRNEGIDVSALRTDREHVTAIVFAFIDKSGERRNVTWPNAGAAHSSLATEDIDESVWNDASWFHTTGMNLGESPLREATIAAMRAASKRHIPVSIDLNLRVEFFGWRPGLRDAIAEAATHADYVLGSAGEELIPLAAGASLDAAVQPFTSRGATVIARSGAEDARCYPADEAVFSVPAFRTPVVDTLGAGDAFNAGFIAALVEGRTLEQAVTWGHGCAAWKLGRSGARSLPRRDELDRIVSSRSK